MVDYKKNLDALKLPWVESPFFSELINNNNFSNYEKSLAKDFNKKGYVVIDLELKDDFIEKLIIDLQKHQKSDFVKTNSSFFSYNDSPRIVDAGKFCPGVVDLALDKKVLSILKLFYRKNPVPFSTINFFQGTEQPLHSDTIHFGSIPKGYLSACWVALEDTDDTNGALKVVEGSHKLRDIDYYDLNIMPAKNIKMVEKIYRDYEEYVVRLVETCNLEERIIRMKKGTALIWSANLLHGGGLITDYNKTRFSQVTHYNFDGCENYYHPFFSIPNQGKYIKRDIENLSINNLLKS